jgi:hypothetical protein
MLRVASGRSIVLMGFVLCSLFFVLCCWPASSFIGKKHTNNKGKTKNMALAAYGMQDVEDRLVCYY